jgi:hypothetical protein
MADQSMPSPEIRLGRSSRRFYVKTLKRNWKPDGHFLINCYSSYNKFLNPVIPAQTGMTGLIIPANLIDHMKKIRKE